LQIVAPKVFGCNGTGGTEEVTRQGRKNIRTGCEKRREEEAVAGRMYPLFLVSVASKRLEGG
jgi:hypothetical protein